MKRITLIVVIWAYMATVVTPYSVKFAGQGHHSYELDYRQINEEIKPSHTHVHLQMNSTQPVFVEFFQESTSLLGTIRSELTLDITLPRTFLDFLDAKKSNSESDNTIVLVVRSEKVAVGEISFAGIEITEPSADTANETYSVKIEYDLEENSRKIYKIAGLNELFGFESAHGTSISITGQADFDILWGKCDLYFPDGPVNNRDLKKVPEAEWTSDILKMLSDSKCPSDNSTEVEMVLTTYGKAAKGEIWIYFKLNNMVVDVVTMVTCIFIVSSALMFCTFVKTLRPILLGRFLQPIRIYSGQPVIIGAAGRIQNRRNGTETPV